MRSRWISLGLVMLGLGIARNADAQQLAAIEPSAHARPSSVWLTSEGGPHSMRIEHERGEPQRETCTTPCALELMPGTYRLESAGPFAVQRIITIAAGDQAFNVRHDSPTLRVAGVSLLSAGLALGIGAGVALAYASTITMVASESLAIVLTATGVLVALPAAAAVVTGGVLLAASTRPSIEPLQPREVRPPRRSRVVPTSSFVADAQGTPYALSGVAF